MSTSKVMNPGAVDEKYLNGQLIPQIKKQLNSERQYNAWLYKHAIDIFGDEDGAGMLRKSNKMVRRLERRLEKFEWLSVDVYNWEQ